jgi:hypothetical protein
MLRKLIAALCLSALLACPADAVTGTRRVLLAGGGIPAFVKAGASNDMDLAGGNYYNCTVTTCLSVTRALSKTNLIPSSASGFPFSTVGPNIAMITPGLGLLRENAATNQLLNSTAPVTQTTPTLAATPQTLWVNGSGSAALSNGTATGCAGTATNGSPVMFTPTAGTCTVTVTGSLNAFQLEAGSFGTSLIVTSGAPVTRPADAVQLIGNALTTMLGAQGTAFVSGTMEGVNAGLNTLITGTNSTTWGMASNNLSGANGGSYLASTANLAITSGGFTAGIPQKMIGSWKQSNYAVSLNGAAAVTSAAANTLVLLTPYYLGAQNTSNGYNGYLSRMTLWNTQLSNASLPGF